MPQSMTQNPLGIKPVKKLLISFAWPAITANIINALYSIIDQIFIGQGVGYLGNAATNVAFPITTICLAVGLMIGIGAAANFNLELGRGNPDKAKSVVGTSVMSLFIIGIILTILVHIFLEPLMYVFGSTDEILSYAKTFAGISSLGIPFLLISISTNPIVRSDNSPKYSMIAIVFGAILNTILNPIFIFGFKWGIAGSAWATVISQFLSAMILIFYFPRFKSVKFEKKDFIPQISLLKISISLGMTSFVFQGSNMIIQIVTNNLLNIYGKESVYGNDIPIAVAGIVAKINIIFIAIVIGLVQGAQPIFGFNYGAKKYDRVRETMNYMMKYAIIISVVFFAIFEIFPKQIVAAFGNGNELYFEFAVKYMRFFLLFTFINGIQISSSTFFAAIGKPKIGVTIALTKQIIILLPMLFILSHTFGIEGIIYATPITDICAFSVSVFFLIREFRLMPKNNIVEV
ncbi:MATE family efflux transporter [Gemella massiliensis]|uniref:MATE family efflux transporter n=1 Tax=Gemella massiliensis TaxID=1909670 RepID=UPI00093032E8|nr:MATE family efflux transporter [Gemella massiliensis]